MKRNIGRYEIQTELGRGAFGCVYQALDPKMRRQVAIKVLTSLSDPDMVARFHSETFTTGTLKHKNIVTVYDCGEEDGVPYLVMEFLAGQDLKHVIADRNPITLLEKVRILKDVAEGLAYAHRAGVIHRDIKPANTMLLTDGEVKIMDFGIARLTSENATRHTGKGLIVGTVPYMAPEQFLGHDADALTDIFSFGITCYHLLSYHQPFEADQPITVIHKVNTHNPPPLTDFVPECPEALDTVVQKAICKARELRYSSMDDLVFEMDSILLELKQVRAAELMKREVLPRFDGGDFESAETKLREVLELNPAHREAQNLRRRIQQGRQRVGVKKRVEELVRGAQGMMDSRDYVKALESLESASRLDPSDSNVQRLLESAKRGEDVARRAAALVQEARQESMNGNLEAAFQRASQALALDTANPSAAVLVDQIQKQLAQFQRNEKLQAGLQKIRDLSRRGDFDAALSLAARLDAEWPRQRELIELRDAIQAEKNRAVQQARVRYLQECLSQAAAFRHSGKLLEAVALLENLCGQFPEDQRCRALLSEVQVQLEQVLRKQASRDLLAQIGALQAGGQLDKALAAAQRGTQQFPDEPEFWNRALRIADALERTRRETQLQQWLAEADALRAKRQFTEALLLLRKASAEFPESNVVASITALTEKEHRQAEQEAYIRQALDRISQLRSTNLLNEAETVAIEALRRYPAHRELVAIAASLREQVRRLEREKAWTAALQRMEQAIEKKEWDRAKGMLRAAEQDFAGEALLVELAEKIKQGQHWEQLHQLASSVQRDLDNQRWESAETQLAARQAEFGKEETWQKLTFQVEQQRSFNRSLEQAEHQRLLGNLASAEEILKPLLKQAPAYHRVRKQWEAVSAERQLAEKTSTLTEQTAKLIGQNQFTAAQRTVGELLKLNPSHPEAERLKQLISSGLEREKACEEAWNQSRKLERQGRLEEALQIVEKALHQYPGSTSLEASRVQLERAISDRRTATASASAASAMAMPADSQSRTSPAAVLDPIAVAESTGEVVRRPLLAPWIAAALLVVLVPTGIFYWQHRKTPIASLSITLAELPPATVGSELRQQLTAQGGKAPYTWSIPGGNLPAGFTFDPQNGLLAGTPQRSGKASFSVRVSDQAGGSATRDYVFDVNEASAPSKIFVAAGSLPPASVGVSYEHRFHVQGGVGQLLWFLKSGSLPKGVAIQNGALQGIATQPGDFAFTVEARDSTGTRGAAEFSLHVQGKTLEIGSSFLPSGTTAVRYSQALSGAGAPPLRWSAQQQSLPPGLALNPGGVLEGTPSRSGQWDIAVQLQDASGGTVTRQLRMSVNDPPLAILTTSLPSTVVGNKYQTGLSASGGTKQYRWSASGLPAGLSIDPGAGGISGSVASAGVFKIAVRVEDHGSSAARDLTLTVEDAPLPIIAPNKYRGDLSGTVIWSGEVDVIRISRNKAHEGGLDGTFPGTAITVEVSPPSVKIDEPPSASNYWRGMVLRNPERVRTIVIKWKVNPR